MGGGRRGRICVAAALAPRHSSRVEGGCEEVSDALGERSALLGVVIEKPRTEIASCASSDVWNDVGR
jgi:hypothetical protein